MGLCVFACLFVCCLCGCLYACGCGCLVVCLFESLRACLCGCVVSLFGRFLCSLNCLVARVCQVVRLFVRVFACASVYMLVAGALDSWFVVSAVVCVFCVRVCLFVGWFVRLPVCLCACLFFR